MRAGQRLPRQLYVGRVRVRLEFKLADFWIGVYPATGEHDLLSGQFEQHVWICLLPTLPIHLSWWRKEPSRPWWGKDPSLQA